MKPRLLFLALEPCFCCSCPLKLCHFDGCNMRSIEKNASLTQPEIPGCAVHGRQGVLRAGLQDQGRGNIRKDARAAQRDGRSSGTIGSLPQSGNPSALVAVVETVMFSRELALWMSEDRCSVGGGISRGTRPGSCGEFETTNTQLPNSLPCVFSEFEHGYRETAEYSLPSHRHTDFWGCVCSEGFGPCEICRT